MISSSAESREKLKQFFQNTLNVLDIPDLIRIDTNTLDTRYINGLYINNSALQEINFENLEQSPFILIGDNIKRISLNNLKRIESKNISNDNLFYNLRYKFLNNTKIVELYLPNFEGVTNTSNQPDYGSNNSSNSNASFTNNYWLKDVTLGNNQIQEANTHLNGYWFSNCYFLKYLKILYPFVMPLSSNVGFQTSPIGAGNGKIYVPDNLVNEYQEATYWATYNTKIVPLSQYEIDKGAELEIEDSWDRIVERCNNGTAASYYQVGQTKTLEINGCPTQMVIVNKASTGANIPNNCDRLASDTTRPAQLTWMEKTISRFDRYNITSTSPYSYDNSSSFKNIMNNIFAGISMSEPALGAANGIKEVQKSYFGFDTGSSASSNKIGNFKIWAPSAAELGFRQNQTNLVYDYFKDANNNIVWPNYRLGETNLYTIDNSSTRVNIALRDFESDSNPRPAVVQSEADQSILNTNPGVNSYIIFGFCT